MLHVCCLNLHIVTNYDLILGHMSNEYVTNGQRKSGLTWYRMDNKAYIVI